MAFPLNPVNGQLYTNGGYTYQYSTSRYAWTKVATVGANIGNVVLVGNTITTGNATSNTIISGNAISTGNATSNTTISVGNITINDPTSNTTIGSNVISTGNATSNTTIGSGNITFNDPTSNTTIGSNVISTGNATSNTTIGIGDITINNPTSNTVIGSNTISTGNATSNTTIGSGNVVINDAIGNTVIRSNTISTGNATSNTTIGIGDITINDPTSNTTITSNVITTGNITANNVTVNDNLTLLDQSETQILYVGPGNVVTSSANLAFAQNGLFVGGVPTSLSANGIITARNEYRFGVWSGFDGASTDAWGRIRLADAYTANTFYGFSPDPDIIDPVRTVTITNEEQDIHQAIVLMDGVAYNTLSPNSEGTIFGVSVRNAGDYRPSTGFESDWNKIIDVTNKGNVKVGGSLVISPEFQIIPPANTEVGIYFADGTFQYTAATSIGNTISVSGNITGGNLISNGIVTATGNITGGNLVTAGNATANYFIGNGAFLTGISATSSNVAQQVYVNSAAASSYFIVGAASTGNTSLYAKSGIEYNGTSGNVSILANLSVTGNVTGNYIIGDGSLLTNVAGGGGHSISYGTSNVEIATADGNVDIAVNGVANTAQFSQASLFVQGPIATPKVVSVQAIMANNVNGVMISPVTIQPAGNIFVPSGSTLTIFTPA